LFITSTYRDLAGFFAALCPGAGRLVNNASSESDGGGNTDGEGLGVGNATSFDVTSFVGGVVEADGVGGGGSIVVVCVGIVVERGVGIGAGGVEVEGAFEPGRFGGGGGGAAFGANSSP